MRIALCGASGTGKTTLAKWIADEYDLELNPVGSRSVSVEMGFESPYDVDKAGKREEFQRRLLSCKMDWERRHESFVTDRTTFDNLVYTMLHDVHCIRPTDLDLAVRGVHRYTHVIFCPMRVVYKPGSDPARVKDETYHRIFEITLRGLFAEFLFSRPGVRFFIANVADEGRYSAVGAYLAKHG